MLKPEEMIEDAAILAEQIRERPNDLEDALIDDAPAAYSGHAHTVSIQVDELARFRHSHQVLCRFAALMCGVEDVNDLTYNHLLAKLDPMAGNQPSPVIPPDATAVEPPEPFQPGAILGLK